MKRDSPYSIFSEGELFRLVWRGWFAAVLVLSVPILLLVLIVLAAQGSWDEVVQGAIAIVLMPIIAAMQGLMVSGLVWLGLLVWPPNRVQQGG